MTLWTSANRWRKAAPRRTVLNVVPGAEADCEFTLSGDDGAEKYRPQADDTRLLAELSAIASTLKPASLSDIEMRGFTFDQNADASPPVAGC
ncbi:hypothetical protein ACVXG8_17875 [Escherichia coli]